MAVKLMYIPKDDSQNYSYCRLKLVVETFGYSTLWSNQIKIAEVSKVVRPTNKTALYKTGY